jgi:hypothetical protein
MVFLCEVCGELVKPGDKSARISADLCVSDGQGGWTAPPDDEVVFAVFHTECVLVTYAARDCDAVPYLSEARELIDGVA